MTSFFASATLSASPGIDWCFPHVSKTKAPLTYTKKRRSHAFCFVIHICNFTTQNISWVTSTYPAMTRLVRHKHTATQQTKGAVFSTQSVSWVTSTYPAMTRLGPHKQRPHNTQRCAVYTTQNVSLATCTYPAMTSLGRHKHTATQQTKEPSSPREIRPAW